MSGPHRLAKGGLIDRDNRINFRFDGKPLTGCAGDTLASALLANGVRLVGRSFKYHRPRGIVAADSSEPNALLTIGRGSKADPNVKATIVELREDLEARSQNRFPSLRFDIASVTDWFSPFIGAGFYYKTFMWPSVFWEKVYEPLIRRSAGLGAMSGEADPGCNERAFAHCDILVIGSGPAGLEAALCAGRAGARVILCEEDFLFGGRLNSERMEVARTPSAEWVANTVRTLEAMGNVRLMDRTCVFGCYDGGTYGALEALPADNSPDSVNLPELRYWRIVAKRTILAAGAHERMVAFGNNDRPGIILASAARSYVNRFAVAPGTSTVLFTNNDDGWRTARDLFAAGCDVEAIVDLRPAEEIGQVLHNTGDIPLFTRSRIIGTSGRLGLQSITVLNANGKEVRLKADCLAVAGGWNPTIHLACHLRGRPVWNDRLAAFVPGSETPRGMYVAGAANGTLSTHGALAQGTEQAGKALSDLGFKVPGTAIPDAEDMPVSISPFWHVKDSRGRAWLDLQNDVTIADVELAHREGFDAVEHLKRYTTLGMGTDQGRVANVPALAILAQQTGKSIPQTGTTAYRPPYVPVAISALAGHSRGRELKPCRLTPSHDWAREQNAVFIETGAFLRAQWFPRRGETGWRQGCDREAMAVRKVAGVIDVSTLGKFDLKGSDAATFLDRVYANFMSTLEPGRIRYGLMLREDGFVFDDGTVSRFGENHFVLTSTSAKAERVLEHLDFCAQVLWPELDVHVIPVTDHHAQFCIAGPSSRAVLERLTDDPAAISNSALPHMGCIKTTLCGGVPARLFRVSFSGELSFEIAIAASYGDGLIRALMRAGKAHGAVPYGLEALNVLRIEKGHPVGTEIDGRTTAGDLGLARMVSNTKDCVGRVMANRPGLTDRNRKALTGFKPVDLDRQLAAGAHFVQRHKPANTGNDEGWLSSACFSPSLGHSIGLGFITRGAERHGETVRAVDLVRGTDIEVEICPPVFVDPNGERMRV